jgi:hypothetical protein
MGVDLVSTFEGAVAPATPPPSGVDAHTAHTAGIDLTAAVAAVILKFYQSVI